jgi:hypothetical protein
VAGPRRTRHSLEPDRAAEKAVERFLSRHELRYILIEILIVATGVFIALVVDELRQTFARRALIAETRATLRNEIVANRSRVLFKLRLIHDAALILDRHPEQAAQLVSARANSLIVPFEAEWTFATQNDVLRYLPTRERRRLTNAYVINAGYAEMVHDEMNAWTELAGAEGASASPAEAREREKAVALWLAYAQRLALASCVSLFNVQQAIDGKAPRASPLKLCAGYRAESDPAIIYRELGLPVPAGQPI